MEPKFYKIIDADAVDDLPLYVIGLGGKDADKSGSELEEVVRHMMRETREIELPPNLILESVTFKEAMEFTLSESAKKGEEISVCPVCYYTAEDGSTGRKTIDTLIENGGNVKIACCPEHAREAKYNQTVHVMIMRGLPSDMKNTSDFLDRIAGHKEVPDVLLTLITSTEMRDRSLLCLTPEGFDFFEKAYAIYHKEVMAPLEENDEPMEIGDLFTLFANAIAETDKLRQTFADADLNHSDVPVSSTLQ